MAAETRQFNVVSVAPVSVREGYCRNFLPLGRTASLCLACYGLHVYVTFDDQLKSTPAVPLFWKLPSVNAVPAIPTPNHEGSAARVMTMVV